MLEEALRATSASAGLSVVEIVGEAGIGKTTLLGHLGAAATAAGALVLSGGCSEFERDIPYGLLIEALDAHLAANGPPTGLTSLDLTVLATTFPALHTDAREDTAERHQLHRAVRNLLERLAAPRGLVLLLDDLHWADPASIAFVASLVRRPSSSRLLLAVAHRHRQAGSALDPELRRAAAAGQARRLAPGPLTAAEAEQMLPSTLGERELRRLHAESGGNPFHLMQLARVDTAGRPAVARASDPGHAEVPEAVREAVLSETAPLPTDARALLDGASIVTRRWSRSTHSWPRTSSRARTRCGAFGSGIRSFAAPSTRRSVRAGDWPGTRAPRRAWSERAPDRPRSRTTWSSPPRRATPPLSRFWPRLRPRSAAARRRRPCIGSRSRERSYRGLTARSRRRRCSDRSPVHWLAPGASTTPGASCWSCSNRFRRIPRRARG